MPSLDQAPPLPGPGSKLLSELSRECRPANLLAATAAGLVVALSAIVSGIGVAALIFTGPLQAHLFSGIGMVLAGAVVMLSVLSLSSSYPGSLCLPQEVPAVILGLLASALYSELSQNLSIDQVLPLVMLGIALATVITGVCFWLLGRWKLGAFIRFIPFPMIGGVLAGLGWLLLQGGVTVLTGEPLILERLPLQLNADNLLRLGSGVLVAMLLLGVTARVHHFAVIPSLLLLSIVLFYLTALPMGQAPSDLQSNGWLLGPFPAGSVWAPPGPSLLAAFDWGLFLQQLPIIGTLVLASTVSILLYASGLELGVRRDMDLNHELSSCGLANVLAGLAGGVPGFHSMGDSLLAKAMGAPFRLTGLLAALMIAACLLAGFSILAWFPRPVLGGLLFFLGAGLLHQWVWQGYRSLPFGDWLVVMLILAVSAWMGFLAGIGVGIVAGIVLFTVNYSRVDVTKHELSGAEFHSNVDRPANQRQTLQQQGRRIQVLTLQGFVFFGTANKVLDRVAQRLARRDLPPLSHLVLDFQRVNGMDMSSVITFRKMEQLAEAHHFQLVLTGLSGHSHQLLAESELELDNNPRIHLAHDLDHGLEHCEQALLQNQGEQMEAEPAQHALLTLFQGEDLADYASPCQFQTGERLIRQGDEDADMYLILEGRVSVHLEGADLGRTRLRSYGPGTLVGEMAFYLGGKRSASVVADQDTRALHLSRSDLQRLSTDQPQLGARFHQAMAMMLAERLSSTNRLLQRLS